MKRIISRLAFLILMTLSLLGLYTLRSVWEEAENAKLRLQSLEGRIEQMSERNALLEKNLRQQGSETELARIGREQLFLAYPDEKIIITGN